jgi:hypothetical protein
LVLLLAQCNNRSQETATPAKEVYAYLNMADSIGYVGINTCKQCHSTVHQTFQHTGMGMSFGKADTAKSAAIFKGKEIYDADLDMHYKPFWKGDTALWLMEYRMRGRDTVHKLVTYIDYIVGSGQHTNSHILNEGGYHFQAPFTWYAQKQKLDLPPGYEQGANNRFERPIGLECMSCHNAMPTKFVTGSYNKFESLPMGIDCERCHGPGALHVKRVSNGQLVDTSKAIDYSIVNPKKLSTQLQFELCQRCHLQGNAVLAEGKSFFSFKPGMELKSVMDVYLPRYEHGEDQFIMASHADRLKLSNCFLKSEGSLTCISCHNPHISVKATNVNQYNLACQGCHSKEQQARCTADEAALVAENNNCVHCHMPMSGSTDIPHVTVHDHYIRKPQTQKIQELGRFLGLRAINNTKPSLRSRILAYLQQYERFGGDAQMLDSAASLLVMYNGSDAVRLKIHLLSLQQNFNALTAEAEKFGGAQLRKRFCTMESENRDAWLHYRIGEGYMRLNKVGQAQPFLEQADSLAPYVLNFKSKLADCYQRQGALPKAEATYRAVLQELPTHKVSLNNLGFVYVQLGRLGEARIYLERCKRYHPDYEQLWLNLAQLALLEQNPTEVKEALQQVLRINPDNVIAMETLNQLGGA